MQPASCSSPAERTMMGSFIVPRRLASRGRMSKTSTPSIFPRISNRSKPVACSRSDGTVPVLAPGPMRSSAVFTSLGRNRGQISCSKRSFVEVMEHLRAPKALMQANTYPRGPCNCRPSSQTHQPERQPARWARWARTWRLHLIARKHLLDIDYASSGRIDHRPGGGGREVR